MKELQKNNRIICRIDGYSSEALGVAHAEGRAVFVPGAIPGERWELLIVKAPESGPVYAKGLRLLEESPMRRAPDCPVYERCGGCDCRHLRYEEELRFKLARVNDALTRIGKQTVTAREILGGDACDRYRNKAIFAVGESGGEAACGFFRPRSHSLIPVEDCLLQSELSCRAARCVTAWMREEGVQPYDELSGRGAVRHVFCRESRHGKDAVVCVVSAGGFGEKTRGLIRALRADCPELTGIVLNINKNRGNTVLAGEFYTLWGRDSIRDTLCGLEYEIAPRAFFQVNPAQAERLYRQAEDYVFSGPAELVFDLYCGAGTISLLMARRAARVIGAEIVPEAVGNARQNAVRNGVGNAEFLCGDAGEAAAELAARGLRPDAVVVDPPRKGMSEDAVRAVASMRPERIVYVSCDPATLARDILRFEGLGYALREAKAVDMFPRTRHVETVCCLYHQKKDFISVPYEPKDAEYLNK